MKGTTTCPYKIKSQFSIQIIITKNNKAIKIHEEAYSSVVELSRPISPKNWTDSLYIKGSLIGRKKDCKKSGILIGRCRESSILTTNSGKLE